MGVEVLSKRVQQANGDVEALTSLPDVIENPVLQKLKGEYITLLREFSDLSKRYKDQHPRLVRLNSQIQTTKKKLDDVTREISKNILTRFQVAAAREKSLSQSLEEQKQEALQLNRLGIQYHVLKREADTNQKLYENMLTRSKETDLLEGLKTTNIRIVDRAKVPNAPERPRTRRNIFIAMVGSLLCGVLFVFFLDHLDTRIRAPEEAEAIIGAPLLGVVPALGKKLGLALHLSSGKESTDRILMEHFRELRAMVVFRLGTGCKVIQVTSCLPREGKTFVTANLALALSNSGKKVLVIDGDFHRAGIQQVFRIRGNPGLVHVLIGEAELADAIRPIAKMPLKVLPAGRMRGTSSGFFESANFRSVIDRLRADFDYIVVDSPPVLAVSDPLIWSQCVDGVLFVVDVQQVTIDMLRQSVSKLKELEVSILGVVMNRLAKHHNYYYYGYSQKYDYYRKMKGQDIEEKA